MDANAKSMREDIKCGQAEMRSILDAWITDIKDAWKKMTACQEVTGANPEKIEPDLGKMQSVEEHQEIPKENSIVKPVKGRKKRHRDRKPAAGRRGEPNELTRGDCGSGKKLAAACKKITGRETVAWCKRNVLRKIVTQGNCELRSTLTAAGIMMTCRAGVAWLREMFVRKDRTKSQAEQETMKGRKDGGLWNGLKCNSGIKDPRTRQQLHLGNERTTSMIYRKAIRLEIVERALRISSVFRKTRKWILWRGRPPPKRKKR
jgi:hypothetical protein